ncbi:ATP-binding protein, partial [Chloroflexota bacterium]
KYREDNLSKLDMQGIFPVWGRDTAELTKSFIALGFQAVVTCIDSRLLDKRFAGRTLDKEFLADLPLNVDPGGENGEFHSFVFDGPIFKKRIDHALGELVLRDSFYYCDLLMK